MIDSHKIRATIDGVPLEVISATFTLDERWSPYGQASLTCALPDNIDTVDPRESLRVDLRAEQSFGVGVPISRLTEDVGGSIAALTAAFAGSIPLINATYFRSFNNAAVRASKIRRANLSLRRREINWSRGTVNLELATDEALLQSYALVSTSSVQPGLTSVRSLTISVLDTLGAFLQSGTDDGEIEVDAAEWMPGVSAWDYLAPLVQSAGLRLYCDELRRWYLVTDDTTTAGQLTLTDARSITEDADTIDLDGDWYDAVVITYEWVDDLGDTQREYDVAAEENFTKVLTVNYDRPYPGAGAASRVLSRALGRGRAQDVRAVSDYTGVPGQAVSITVAGDDTQVGFVSSIAWQWPAAEMNVKSRALVDAPPESWILDPAGVAWEDLDVGIDWTEDL